MFSLEYPRMLWEYSKENTSTVHVFAFSRTVSVTGHFTRNVFLLYMPKMKITLWLPYAQQWK